MLYYTTRLIIIGLFINLSNPLLSQTVSLEKTTFAPGEKIVVSYSGFPGNSKDWVSLAKAGTADDQYIIWVYTEGRRSGTQIFDGLPYGDYEVRGYYNNESIIRTRLSFRVGNPDAKATASVKTQRPVYTPEEKIVVEFSGLPGNGRDWVSIAKAGTAEAQYIGWYYTEGKQSGSFTFNNLPEGDYEARAYFNNESAIRARYNFKVQKTSESICRGPLSVFYQGMAGLGLAWGRTTLEPTVMTSKSVSEMQSVLGNAREAFTILGKCIPFDINKLVLLISRLPGLTNVQAEAEIRQMIMELQTIIAQSPATCDNGATLSSLFGAGVHVGAAKAHAFGRICQPAPMPSNYQTVIRNHLNTAKDAFAGFLSCVPGFSLSQFDSIPLNSTTATDAYVYIYGLHTLIVWNIGLSNCCCYCK